MKNNIKSPNNQKGVSLIAAVFIIVILAFMGVVFVSMIGTGSLTAANDIQSAQALYVAQGGAQVAKYQMKSGTACGSLTNTNVPLGPAGSTFTTSGIPFNPAAPVTLSAAINATATTIPVSPSPAGNYAPQGRITIDSEMMWYGRISGNNFINVQRGVGGTPAAAHNTVGVPVTQNQCRITSTGTVGGASRVVIADVSGSGGGGGGSSAFHDGAPTSIGTTATSIADVTTTLGGGENLIIVAVTFQNTSGVNTAINAGDLQLSRGGTALVWNQNLIRVFGTTTPGANNFPQETQFLLYKDTGVAANPTYTVTALATQNNRIAARVQMVILNNVLPSYFFDEPTNITLGTGAPVVLSTHATGLPAGDNVILAAVQLDNNAGANRNIVAGALCLRRGPGVGGTILAQNRITIGMEQNGSANEGTGFLLIARDQGAAANQTYTVTGYASGNNVLGEVKMLVFNGLQSAFVSPGVINPLPTTLYSQSLSTTFPAGDNIIIASSQYYNSHGSQIRRILVDQLVYGAVTSANVTPIYLATGNQVDDYVTGLLLRHTNAPASPTYNWQSQADGNNVRASTDLIAVHLAGTSSVVDFGSQ